jgi:hypothetical protein
VLTTWTWEAGAILTRDEIETLRDPGDFRKDGKEYVGVAAPEIDLEELNLLVKLPEDYAPPRDDVEVWTSATANAQWERNEGLTRLVQEMGQASSRCAFLTRLPKFRYALCWHVAPRAQPAGEVTRQLLARSAPVFGGVRDALAARLPADARIGLYVRDDSGKMLRLLEGNGAPATIEIDEPSGIVRGAWWGRTRTVIAEPGDPSTLFLAGETYVVFAPLKLRAAATCRPSVSCASPSGPRSPAWERRTRPRYTGCRPTSRAPSACGTIS